MRQCKICSNPELAKKVNHLLAEGISNYQILKQTPEISDCNLRNHKKHMTHGKDEELIKQRLQLESIMALGSGDFIVDMRNELESLCIGSTRLIKEAMIECAEGNFSRKLSEYTNTLSKLMTALDTVSGLRQQSSIDAAIETLSRAGYEIVGTQEKEKEESKTTTSKLTTQEFKEYLDWKKAKNATT